MSHQEFQDLAALDALGALDEQEIVALHRHLSECDECQTAEREYQESASLLALALDPVEPPSRVRAQLMRHVEGDSRTQDLPSPVDFEPRRRSWWALAAAVFFLALFGWSELRVRANREELQQLAATTRELSEENRRVKTANETLASQVRELSSPSNRTVELIGQAAAPSARARVFLNDQKRAGFIFFQSLPPTNPDQEYELWVIREGAPAPEAAGKFEVDSTGEAKVLLKDLPVGNTIKAIAVTLEPKGGAAAAEGEKYLVGSL